MQGIHKTCSSWSRV